MTMIDPPSQSYDNAGGFEFTDKDSRKIGEIIYEDDFGQPLLIFQGEYGIALRAYDPTKKAPEYVMYTENPTDGNPPGVRFPYVARAQSFIGNTLETNYVMFENSTLETRYSPTWRPLGLQMSTEGEIYIGAHGRTNDFQLGEGTANLRLDLRMNGKEITGQSDRRIKKNIETNEYDVLEDYKDLNFVNFEYIDQENYAEGQQWGLIAQDAPLFNGYDEEEELWYISSSKQIMVNSMAIKQLKQENDQLRKDLETALKLASEAYTKVEKLEEQINETTK